MKARLRVLLVHQSFPSQFVGVMDALLREPDIEVAAIGMREFRRKGLAYYQYSPPGHIPNPDWVIDDFAQKAMLAGAAAAQARSLQFQGFYPDVIIVHPGWGEGLYLRDIFPKAKMICYCEYYYMREGGDIGFDPEFPVPSLDMLHRLRGRNAVLLASLDDADLGVAPTKWQRSTFPKAFQSKIQVLHEGVDDRLLKLPPLPSTSPPRISYTARYLEPHRGFHTFMRALPEIQSCNPDVRVDVIGLERGGYGAPPVSGLTWKQELLNELGGKLDRDRVKFHGSVSYDVFIETIRRASLHVYLTYPFVLSWSALEAMALGRPIVASRTQPVTEFMAHGQNSILADCLAAAEQARAIVNLLNEQSYAETIGSHARDTVIEQRLTRTESQVTWLQLLRRLHG